MWRANLYKQLIRLWRWLSLGGALRMNRARVLALPAGMLLVALAAPSRWTLFIAYVYLLLLAATYLWVRLVGPRVRLRRTLLGAWAQVGDELEEEWELGNEAWLPLLWVEIEDASTLPGYAARRVAAAGPGERQRWRTVAHCERRGVYRLGPLTARLSDPLGVFAFTWRESAERRIVVYPPLVRLPPLAIPHGQRGGLARADLLQHVTTPSVGGLREYVPGDAPSHIHWPTVARTQQLMVKEFDQERAGALWLVLDLAAGAYPASQGRDARSDGRSGQPAHDDFHTQSSLIDRRSLESRPVSPADLAIVLTCSLAAQALSEGRAVGLLADDGRRRRVAPGRGPNQLWRILGALVDAEATGTLPLGEVLRQGRAARTTALAGAALVVVTPALDGAWLPALIESIRGRPAGALALLVAEQPALAQPIEAQLAACHIAAQTFGLGAPLPLLNPPRRITTRVSPLGKIVRD